MPIDLLSGTFSVKTRAQVRDDYLRDYRFRVPDADTSEQTQPYVDASNVADGLMPVYANAQQLALATSVLTSTGQSLADDGAALGIPKKGKAGATGYLIASAATGGAQVLQGDTFTYAPKNLKLQCLTTGIYLDQQLIPVQALDTGLATNLAGGTLVTVTNPRPGLAGSLAVFTNTDGTGLTGGSDDESDDDYRKRLFANLANPPSSGNEQAVVRIVEGIPGLAVQKAWVVPAVFGPGTTAVCFSMKPSAPGQSRQPNAAQIAIVQAALQDGLPGDDGVFVATGSDHLVRVSLKVTWKLGSAGWVDAVPWPQFYAPPVLVTTSTVPGTIGVSVASGSIAAPTVGNTIALYNATTQQFVPKRILSVTTVVAGQQYTLVFDMATPGASDPNYVAPLNTIVSPWSPSLNGVVAPILSYMDQQGAGEMFASFPDPGRRQRRYPPPAPGAWPSKIENRMVDGLFSVVSDAAIVEPTVPYATTVGTPGTSFYLHRVSDIGVFPQ